MHTFETRQEFIGTFAKDKGNKVILQEMNIDNTSWYTLEKKRARLALLPSIVFVVLVWIAYIIDYAGVLPSNFPHLGILPGVGRGIVGIFFSPFIHNSFSHLLSNTLPLLILIWFLFYFYSKIAFSVFICLWLCSGLLTWIIGRGGYHVGASGLVFALLFFLFFSGIVRKYIPLIAVSLIVAFIYGSTVWSIFPITEMIDASISWEGHLSGAIAGLVFALVFRKQGPQRPQKEWEEEEDDDPPFVDTKIG